MTSVLHRMALRKLVNTFSSKSKYLSTAVEAKKLVIHEYGEPAKVVKLENELLPTPEGKQVLVKMLVSSMNPADINSVQGTYPIKPTLPGVPGFEGVGRVECVGDSVTSVCPGDHVIPNCDTFGTWRSHLLVEESSVFKVDKDVPVVELCGIASNTSTAYRMLKDFVDLEPGDTVIQNGANSSAGQNVIQQCRILGVRTVNVVRDRPDIEELKEKLHDLGADFVLTEEELRKTEIFKKKECKAPKLALNCVGGKSATEVMRKLAPCGVMVTYGGMSREPVSIPTSLFIFKSVSARGFWMTAWVKANRNSQERIDMLNQLMEWMKRGELKAPAHSLVPIDEYKIALEKMTDVKGFKGSKFLIDFRE